MKISHEKAVHLSHVLLNVLQEADEIDVVAEPNDIRNRLLTILRGELSREEEMEIRVRRKIESQKRNIPEGSAEWDILFKKYYEEELTAHGR